MSIATLKGLKGVKEVVFVSCDRIRAYYKSGTIHELKVSNGKLIIKDYDAKTMIRNA